jgi:hypothetical protein
MQIQGSLSGSLSSEIGRLVELRTLAILATMIKGSIPSELGKLTHLGMSRECMVLPSCFIKQNLTCFDWF